MLYKKIGSDRVSAIALGSGGFGSKVTNEVGFAIMDAYLAAGGNVIDTGRIYCGGRSEKMIGDFIKSRGVRDSVFLVTKGGHPALPTWERRISRAELTRDLEESLAALGTECIDLYFLHRDDDRLPVSEIMPILNDFVKAGKVRYIGASNWRAERINEANAFARENGMAEFACSQILWNYTKVNKADIADQTLVVMDGAEYEKYRENGIPVMGYTSLAQGFFDYYAKGEIPPALLRDYMNDVTKARAEQLLLLSARTGITPTALSLNHLLYNDLAAIPVIGVSSVARLFDTLRVFDLPAEDQDLFKKANK